MSFILPFALLLAVFPLLEQLRGPEFLARAREGFTRNYNLEYQEALRTFEELKRQYPQHPAPPLYLAANLWLEELFERQELDLNTFISPAYFTQPAQRRMTAERRQAFFDAVAESQKLSQTLLEKSPGHLDARYFLGAAEGLLASFAITIDRSVSEAFKHGKRAYKYHQEVVQENPDYDDAYMSVGLYEYVVANIPWYIKWLAVLIGYRGSEERAFRYLERAAEKAPFVSDDARTVLMVLLVREGRNREALEKARYLHEKYPRNYLLHINRAQILEKMGREEQALEQYQQVLKLAEGGAPNYQKLPLPVFRYQVGNKLMQLKRMDQALEQFEKVIQNPHTPEKEKALSYLHAGMILDAAGKRSEAVEHYQQVLQLKESENSHHRARRYLKESQR